MRKWHKDLRAAAALLREARSTVALTGAGISVASGIPDFRSPGGLWSRFDPERVASTWGLRHDPRGVWEFLLEVLAVLDKASPNPAHAALAWLEARGRLRGVITQNIDGLHQAAGSRAVVEYHGGCGRFHCQDCGRDHPRERALTLGPGDIPWRCGCGGLIRPEVVFFGEPIPAAALEMSQRLLTGADAVLIVGTSGEVAPAGSIPLGVKARGGVVVEINLGETAYGRISDIRLDAPAEQVLPALAEALNA